MNLLFLFTIPIEIAFELHEIAPSLPKTAESKGGTCHVDFVPFGILFIRSHRPSLLPKAREKAVHRQLSRLRTVSKSFTKPAISELLSRLNPILAF